jgi:hypothetical protein
MLFYLPLALIWLIVGAALVVWHRLDPDAPGRNFLGTDVSAGWLAVVLGMYNLVRWWATRSVGRRQQALDEDLERRRRRDDPERPRDPTFDFSDPPAGGDGPA